MSNVDISTYQPAEKLVNPHEHLIVNQLQIAVPENYDKEYVNSPEQLLNVLERTDGNVAIYVAPAAIHL